MTLRTLMRPFLRLLLLPVLLVGLFGGCSERSQPTPLTYTQLLTGQNQKSWKLVSIIIVDQGTASRAISPAELFNPCRVDDLYTFYNNTERRFEYGDGATKCKATDPDVLLTDNWTLINANASLEFPLPVLGIKYPYIVKNLTASVLTIEFYFPDINASYRFTFNSVSTK